MSASADQNLLLGILALQMGFVTRDAVIAAIQAWTFDRSKSIGRILVENGTLSEEGLSLLEPLIATHTEGNDAADQSRAIANAACSIHREVEALNDHDLTEALAMLLRLPAATDPEGPSWTTPHRVVESGRFEILRPYARGGLGEVFIARDLELNREVVLKEIRKHAASDPNNRARFLWEAEVTGRLEHPGIVPVYGRGMHPDGRPFYVMRWIEGETLKHAIKEFHGRSFSEANTPDGRRTSAPESNWRRSANRMSIDSFKLRELLSRLIAVSNAIGYAHSRGILHRDLKPSNIILGKFGETLVVDWGLAKAMGKSHESLESEPITKTPTKSNSSIPGETVAGLAIGTPAFMSPEQASGRLEALGPATDIYGLGATLYCVLTGRPPFDHGYLGDTLRMVERGQFARPRAINPNVPQAMEAICLKAMATDPANRYPSAQAFAADIEHWLAGEPVSAWREPLRLRFARSARRHKALVASAIALFLALTVSLAVGAVLIGREQARTAQAKAEVRSAALMAATEARTARAVAQFLIDMFAEPTPFEFLGIGMKLGTNDVNVASRALLERGAHQLIERLDDQPVLKAALLAAIAGAHTGTGSFEQAAPLLEQALAIRRRELPPHDPQLADNILQLSHLYFLQGRSTEAQQLARECLAIRRATAGETDDAVTTAKVNLAFVLGLPGDGVPEAERLWREVLELQRRKLDANDPRLAETLLGLSGVLLWGPEVGSEFRPLEAAPLFNEAVKIFSSHDATRGVGLAVAGFQRAIIARRLGNAQLGAAAYKDAYHLFQTALGDSHPMTIYVMHDYAECLFDAGKRDEARAVYDTLFGYYQEHGMPFVTALIEEPTLKRFASLLEESKKHDKLKQTLRAVLAKQKALTRYRAQNDVFLVTQLVALLRVEMNEEEARLLVEEYLTTSNVLHEMNIVGNVKQRDALAELLRGIGRTSDAQAVNDKSYATMRSPSRE
jgi:serine/threonine-protein kinase